MSPMEVVDWYNASRPKMKYGSIDEDQAKALTDRINANPDKYM